MKHLLRRPSPAMAVAGVALVSSFAAPAFADDVARIAKSVTGKQIENGTVTGADIKDKTVRGRDIAPGAISGNEVLTNSISGRDIEDGTLDARDVKDDSLGGRQIAEGTLGLVPHAAKADVANLAAKADRADKAGDADALQGKTPADFVAAERVLAGKAEMKVGDPEQTVVAFNGYKVTAQCVENPSSEVEGPMATMRVVNESAGTSQIQTWWTDTNNSTSTDNEFENGESQLLIRNAGTNWQGFKWEQYGPLNLFNTQNGTYLWGGAGAAGINVGDHDCVLVFRSLLA